MSTDFRNNKKIWKHTQRTCDEFDFSPAEKITINSPDIKPDQSLETNQPSAPAEKQNVFVFHEYFLDAAESFASKHYSVLLVNNSSPNEPYSALDSGAAGDEFDLFRKSNYALSMHESHYPISNNEMIFTPKFTVYKDSDYLKHPSPFELASLAISPVNSPEIISISEGDQSQRETYASDSAKSLMSDKISAIFDFAESRGFDCLLINNFGGGKFNNPVLDLIEMYNDSIAKHPGIPCVAFTVRGHKQRQKDKEFMIYHKKIIRQN